MKPGGICIGCPMFGIAAVPAGLGRPVLRQVAVLVVGEQLRAAAGPHAVIKRLRAAGWVLIRVIGSCFLVPPDACVGG